jgi:hypothetical protein
VTSITPSDSYYSSRYRLRDQTTEAAPLDVTAILPKAPSLNLTPVAKQEVDNSAASSASLSSALWDMESSTPVRTTLSGKPADTTTEQLLAELQKWSQMTPAEMIRAKVLEDKGLTEESLAAMPAEERKAILKEIADTIKNTLGIDTAAEDTATAPQASIAEEL